MKKIVLSFMLIFFVSGCSQGTEYQFRYVDNQANVSHLQQSVVAIVSANEEGSLEGPTCTAFYITQRRLATALHCVEDRRILTIHISRELIFQIAGEDAEPTLGREILFISWEEHTRVTQNSSANIQLVPTHSTVIAIDQENDIAILELIESEPNSSHWLPITLAASVGERVYALGMPNNQFWLLSEGVVSSIRHFSNGTRRILHHNLIAPGSSGSPVINNSGEVVGVTVQYVRNIPNLGIAAPGNAITTLLFNGGQTATYVSIEEALEMLMSESCNPDISSCSMPSVEE